MSLRTVVAARVKSARHQRGLSQEALARKCGLSVSFVSMLERAQRAPALETLEALSRGLGVSPGWLVEGGGGRRR